MKTYRKSLLILTALLLILSGRLCAQDNPNLQNGFVPFGSYDGSSFDSINLFNGNLTIHIPLFNYPQRGSLPGQIDIVANTKNFIDVQTCNTKLETCTLAWLLRTPYTPGIVPVSDALGFGTFSHAQNAQGLQVRGWDGSAHQLIGSTGSGFETVDASGVFANNQFPDASFINKNGNATAYNTNSIGEQDTNGNYFQGVSNGYTDTLGRTVTTTSYPGPNGAPIQVQLTYATITVQTNFKATATDMYSTQDSIREFGPGNISMLQSVAVYNGSSWTTSPTWTFEYNDRDGGDPPNINYGNVTKVTLPTGGSISYAYRMFTLCSIDAYILTPVSRGVTSRTVDANDGTGPHTTTGTGTVDPLGNYTIHAFTGLGNSCSYYETETKYYQGSSSTGHLLKTVDTAYTYQANPLILESDPSVPTVVSVLPTTITTTLDNGLVSKVVNTWDTKLNTSIAAGLSYGNLMQKQEYDYGPGAPPSLPLRTTVYTYLAFDNPSYLALNMLDRVSSVTVYDGSGNKLSQTIYGYDETAPVSSGITTNHASLPLGTLRGNQTSVKRWLNTTGTTLNTTTSYFDTGMPYQITDPLGNLTTYAYSSSYVGAYRTQTKMPQTGTVQHIINGTYDLGTGKLTSFTDQNSQLSSYQYDPLWRLTTASFPDGGLTTFSYANLTTVQRSTNITSSLVRTDINLFDGLGRGIQSQLTTDPDGTTYSVTTYDAVGQKSTVTNPYRTTSDPTYGISTTQYDALGRVTLAIPPDGSPTANNISNVYSGNCTTATDQAGASRKSCTDGLGRLTQVFEDPAGLNYETDYTYDALNNLLAVNQKGASTNSALWRARTFTYDSLSRLTQAVNPESGSIKYSYDADGNLLQKTGPAPNQTGSATVTLSYCYDALNRLTGKAYTAQTCSSGLLPTPLVIYFYDQSTYNGFTITNGIGHRTGMLDQAGAEAWSYDKMGRALNDNRTTNSLSKPVTYAYNLDGSLLSLSYSGYANNATPATFSYTPGGAGRPLALLSGSSTFVGDAHYTPSGANCYLQDYWDGTWTSVGTFNSRLQPRTYQVVQQFSGTPPTVCTAMTTVAGIMDFSYNFVDSSSHNNGNVQTIANNGDWHRWQSFTYDSLNRIASAQTAATNKPAYQGDNSIAACWAETFTYDGWGNLLSLGPNATTQPNYVGCTQESGFNYTNFTSPNNRVTYSGFTYDAAGNMIAGPGTTYVYDAENHLTFAGGVNYTYDGDGKRVMKSNGTIYWYGSGSDAFMETDLSDNMKFNYFHFNGQRVAREDTSNSVNWYFADHLGSSRVVWSLNGSDDSDFYPFGGERVITTGAGNKYKFTGKERDTESGLDNFGARYNSSTVGRFMSVDPSNVSIDKFNPQSWNRYSYTYNNPLKYVDQNGKWPTEIHNQIIDRAFPGLSQTQRQALKDSSAHVDRLAGQTKAHNHEHAMKSPGEDPAVARRAIEQNIENHEQAAQHAQGGTPEHAADINPGALNEFGQALHTTEDRTSPAHTDQNGNPRDWNGIPTSKSEVQAAEQHSAEEATITPEQMNNSIRAAQDAFGQTFGTHALKEAETPPKPIEPNEENQD